MNTYSSNVIAQTVHLLQAHDMRRDKLMLHKFLFFIEFMGIPSGMKFEPYTYGPFSFDLANNLDFMCRFGLLSSAGTNYNISASATDPNTETELSIKLAECLERFIDCLGGVAELTFGALECLGTILYCHLVLKKFGPEFTDDAVLEEFKKWKGEKYPDESIRHYLGRLHSLDVI